MYVPLVLTVDDEPDITTLISYHLKRAGYRVRIAATGREALEIIARESPDLVLLDLMLPDMDGFSLCEAIRSNAVTAATHIVILSGWSPGDSRRIVNDQETLHFVAKPFCSRDLLRRIDRIIGSADSALCV